MRLFHCFAIAILTLCLLGAPDAYAQSPTHVVQPGETLFRIALRYGITVDALRAANGLTGNLIYAGQVLVIPGAGATVSPPAEAATPAPVVAAGEPLYHIVQPGETLFRIGLKYGLPWTRIQAANNLPNDRVYVGQRLAIPLTNAPVPVETAAPAPAAPEATPVPTEAAPQPAPAPAEAVYHIVQPGETLFLIGQKYNVPWTSLQAVNNLPNDRVYAGQRLLITAGTEPAPAPAETAAPAPAATEAAPAPTPAAAGPGVVHIVQRGETLFTIGLKYNLRWTSLQAANNLPDDRIYVGQSLNIPASDSAAPQPAPAPVQGPVAGMSGKYFLVDLSEQRLYAFEGQTLVRTTLISSGRWPTPTVTGTYYIYARYTSTRMRGPGYDLPNVPYTQYFYKGYGLHGTYWHSNFGTPMSHGCVNMPTPEAEWAYYWASMGTPVIVQQ